MKQSIMFPDIMQFRICTRCGEKKCIQEFSCDTSRPEGLRRHCKECHNILATLYREENLDTYRETGRRFHKNHREERCRSSLQRYYKHAVEIADRRKRQRRENQEEFRRKDREYYYNNHEACLAIARRYYNKHKDIPEYRARCVDSTRKYRKKYPQKAKIKAAHDKALYRTRLTAAEGSHTKAEWTAVLDCYGHKCLCCGSSENISLDHIIPLSRGGTNYATNLQPLCQSCNASKQAKHIDYRPDAYWSDWT